MTLHRSTTRDVSGAPLKIIHADTEAEISLALAGPWLQRACDWALDRVATEDLMADDIEIYQAICGFLAELKEIAP